MANIHVLSDVRQASTRTSGDLFINESNPPPRPRCIDLFFPHFRWNSFIVIISIVQIATYIVALSLGSFALTPSMTSLSSMGASYGPAIAAGQVWRLITPLFLHGSIWHILFNVFFQMRMGLSLEADYGQRRVAIAYFLCGLCGNLFSVALAPCKTAVGASTAGFGLIGMQLAEVALTWHNIVNKDQMIFNIALFVFVSTIMSVNPGSAIDWRGHVGGFVGGFSLGVLYNETMVDRPRWYKTGKTAASVVIAGLLIACTAVIFAIPMSSRGC